MANHTVILSDDALSLVRLGLVVLATDFYEKSLFNGSDLHDKYYDIAHEILAIINSLETD